MLKSTQLKGRLSGAARVLGSLIAIFWAVEVVDLLLPWFRLDSYGIWPRQLDGLWGLLFSPFLHAGFFHLAANTVPFAVLGGLVYLSGRNTFFSVSATVAIFGGLGVWIFGGQGVHIGASGLIFGYFGFLLARGYHERRLGPLLTAIFVALSYGGLVYGMLPSMRGISWEGHLFGFLAGTLAAKYED